MARQCTKILICTANQNKAKEISSYLKKLKSLKSEIRIERDPHKVLSLFQIDDSDLFVLDQTGFEKETDTLLNLFQEEWNFPCLIIADRNIDYLSDRIKGKDLLSIIPFDWLDTCLLEMSVQRLLVRQNKSKIQTINNHIRAGLAIVKKQVFIEANDYLCNLLGYSRSEILGQNIKKFFHEKDSFLFHRKEKIHELNKDESDFLYMTLERKDNQLVDVLLLTSLLDDDCISLTIFDVSKQKELKYQSHENEEKINLIAKHMGEGIFWMDENSVILKWDKAMEKIITVPKKEVIGITISDLIDRLVKQSIIKISPEMAKGALNSALSDRSPIHLNRIWEGEILNPQGEYRLFQAESFTMNSSNGNQMAVILRDINDQRQHEKELQFLVELASIIRQSPNDVIKVRQMVCRLLMNLLHLDSIMMAAFQDNHDLGNVIEVHGNLKIKIGMPVSWKNCISQEALYENSIFDISAECLKHLDESLGVSSFPEAKISVPLVNGFDHVGLILIFRSTAFSQYDYRLLDAAANILASALNQAITYERTELRLQRMESLHVVDQAISGLFNLDLTNRIILDQARQLLEADAGDILVLNIATNMMEYSAVFGINQLDAAEKRVHLSRSMAGQVLLTREPCVFSDADKGELPFIMKHLKRNGFRSYFAVPLVAKGEPKGVFEIYKYDPFQPDTEWINFLQALATQSSIAIDNIQLFERRYNM